MKTRFLVLLLVSLASATAVLAQSRPNLILIYTDDQRADDLAYMPHLQELLVEQGLTFDRFFATTPMCGPSRATLLRGQYAHNTGVLTNAGSPQAGFPAWRERGLAASTLATWLQGAGYRTGLAGKYINGYTPPSDAAQREPGWDSWFAFVRDDGTTYYDYSVDNDGVQRTYDDQPGSYSTDVTGEHLLGFMREAVGDGAPFFAYWAPYAPHADTDGGYAIPADRHVGVYGGLRAPHPASFNEADFSDKPYTLPLLSPFVIAQADTLYRSRLESLLAVDEFPG